MIRVMQFDDDQAFRSEVAAYLKRLDGFSYRGLNSADGLEEVLVGPKPDLVLVDLNCPPRGGLEVLRRIREHWGPEAVRVIMLSRNPPGEGMLTRAAQSGADFFLLRPVDLVVLEKRIRQLVKPLDPVGSNTLTLQQVEEICMGYFERLGIPPHFKGYRYLVEGIWLAAVHPEWLSSVTQHLYPAIGQRFAVSGAQVERAMRYALEVAWSRGNVEELYRLFPYVQEDRGKPTNSEFISKMVQLVGLAVRPQG